VTKILVIEDGHWPPLWSSYIESGASLCEVRRRAFEGGYSAASDLCRAQEPLSSSPHNATPIAPQENDGT